MSDTPRTDAAQTIWNDIGMMVVLSSFARQLERELAAKDAHADEIYKAAVNLAAKLEADLATERALADRLAGEVAACKTTFGLHVGGPAEALDAWKEARRGAD